MKLHSRSYFRGERDYFNPWVSQLEDRNGSTYERHEFTTSLGKTQIWELQTPNENPKRQLKILREIQVFPNVGHGIETYAPDLNYLGKKILSSS